MTLDTFFESYHFRQLHRDSIAPIVRSDQAPVRRYGDHHLMVAVRHSAERLASTPESEWDIKAHSVLVYLLWPNTIYGRNEPLMHSWHESLKRVLAEHRT